MYKDDVLEAAPIVSATLKALLAWAPTRGREGADLRASVHIVMTNVFTLLQYDTIGPSLANCFELALFTNINLEQFENVRLTAAAESPVSEGAIKIRSALIQFCLVAQARILGEYEFESREDVERTRSLLNVSFNEIEEDLADRMDAMTYRAVIELHAAVSYFLVETARPLPRMLRYKFNQTLSTLSIAHKLYQDAGRADEVLKENKIVHPAFSPLIGAAFSN